MLLVTRAAHAAPADYAAIAATERALHPAGKWATGGPSGSAAGRVLDFQGHPVAQAEVTLACPDPLVLHTDAQGRWSAPDRPGPCTLTVLARGFSRVSLGGTSSSVSGDLALVRGPRTLGAAIDHAADYAPGRARIALELILGDPEGEDGPTDAGFSIPEAMATERWRTAGKLLPELRGFAALVEPQAVGTPGLVARARWLLADQADPADDALVAAGRHPPPSPIVAPTVEALCPAWQAWLAEGVSDRGLCSVRATQERAALLSTEFTYAHWGTRFDGIARREADGWHLIDSREGSHWDGGG